MSRIFIAIPSFQEEDLQNTVDSIFLNASDPNRVIVGICNQRVVDNEFESFECFDDHVRVVNVRSGNPMGLGFAYLSACQLMQDEEYFMRIDAGTRMKPKWDDMLISLHTKIIDQTNSNKIIISGQCGAFYKTDTELHPDYYSDDRWFFDSGLWFQDCGNPDNDYWIDGLIRQFAQTVWGIKEKDCISNKDILQKFIWSENDKKTGFKEHYFINGAFSFSTSDLIKDCPPDPRVLFWGEEHILGLRACTRGYRIFASRDNVLFTLSKEKAYVDNQGNRDWRNFQRFFNPTWAIQILSGEKHGFYGAPTEQLYREYMARIGLESKERYIQNGQ